MMHVPSPSEYLPFDSNTVAAFQHNQINIYLQLVVVSIVLYDHMITFAMEVERIWTLRWRLPKFLFLTSRYVATPLLIITVLGYVGYPLPTSFCNFSTYFHKPVATLSLLIVELVLLIRVSALYGHSKIMQRFLVCLYICLFVAVTVEAVFVLKVTTPIINYQFLAGCWARTQSSKGTVGWSSSWSFPFICFDGILLLLTLVKTLSYQNNSNPAIRILARDSVFYFTLMFLCFAENIMVATIGNAVNAYIRAEWIACIAVSRLMMNIRGLKFDDPDGTIGVQFSTLQFQKHNSAEDKDDPSGASTEQ